MPRKKLMAFRPRRKEWLDYLEHALSKGQTLAIVLAQLRKSQGPAGWIATGLAATQLGLLLRKEYREFKTDKIYDFFPIEGYERVRTLVGSFIIEACSNVEVIMEENELTLVRGTILNDTIFWMLEDGSLAKGPYIKNENKAVILQHAKEKVWQDFSDKHLLLNNTNELEVCDETIPSSFIEFGAIRDLRNRVSKFLTKGSNRSYLLEGPPGTGKTTVVKHLVNHFNLSSLRLSFTNDNRGREAPSGEISLIQNCESLIAFLQPEALIIDDFDRAWMSERDLLSLLETANKHCKAVFATVNEKHKLSRATQRVGRFDDHIVIDKLEIEVIKTLLDKDLHPYVEQVADWPISFIKDLNKRKRVLGMQAALDEMEDMKKRAHCASEISSFSA